MATRFLDKEFGVDRTTAIANDATGLRKVPALPDASGIVIDSVDAQVKYNGAGTIRTVANLNEAQTLTNKTLTAPVVTGLASTSTGVVLTAGGVITELTGDGAYSISVTLPAGAVLLDFFVTAQAVWTAATSAVLIVGDTADPDGFITNVDAKSVPAAGTSIRPDTVPAGGVDGAYLGDTNGEFVGPALNNFGRYYAAGSVITATITKSGAGTGGRTQFTVLYTVPTTVAQVVV